MRAAPRALAYAFVSLAAFAFAPCARSQELSVQALFTRADKGHCIACHQLPAGASPQGRSDLGPALTGARMRELGKPALRAMLDDPLAKFPESMMPPYGRHRILEAGEIDLLVEFLHALP